MMDFRTYLGVLEQAGDLIRIREPLELDYDIGALCRELSDADGPAALVQNVKDTKAEPSKTFKVNAKKFFEEDQRQLQAWDYCAKRSRKGKKVLDLEAFLTAAGDYIEARGEVVKTAREEAARITGQPLPAEKKKPGEADEPAAPAAKPAK